MSVILFDAPDLAGSHVTYSAPKDGKALVVGGLPRKFRGAVRSLWLAPFTAATLYRDASGRGGAFAVTNDSPSEKKVASLANALFDGTTESVDKRTSSLAVRDTRTAAQIRAASLKAAVKRIDVEPFRAVAVKAGDAAQTAVRKGASLAADAASSGAVQSTAAAIASALVTSGDIVADVAMTAPAAIAETVDPHFDFPVSAKAVAAILAVLAICVGAAAYRRKRSSRG